MAYDAFMWFEGGSPAIKGETTDKVYSQKNAFEIKSFSVGATNPTTIGSATGGAGAGKVSISSFQITKPTDAASPTLFLNCCQGTHFDKAHVVLRQAGGKQINYLEYDFGQVYVETIHWSGASGGDERPMESVNFVFGTIALKYTPQDSKGNQGTPIPAGWDITQGVKQ